MKTWCHRCRKAVETSDFRAHILAHSASRNAPRRRARAKQRGYAEPAIRAAMAEAIRRDGRCQECGSTDDLTAHYPPGGKHVTLSAVYETLCRRCHGRLDGRKAHR